MSKLAISAVVVASLFGATAIASAQTQPAPGASSSGNVGPGAANPAMKPDTTKGGAATQNNNMGTTSGSAMKKGPDASQQGAPTGASTGARGDSTEPGKVKEGATR